MLQDLIRELKGELSGHFEDVVLALLMTPKEYDAFVLREAMKVRVVVGVVVGGVVGGGKVYIGEYGTSGSDHMYINIS